MSFKKFMQKRTSEGRKAVTSLTQDRESTGVKRDERIISTPLKDGEGQMIVRFLPNKPSGSQKNDDVDAYGDNGTIWFEKRYQHNFEMNGIRVIYDCPTSLSRDDIKNIDSKIVEDIRQSEQSDSELAEEYGLTPLMVNRVRHDNGCPICKQNRTWWNNGQEDLVKGFGGSKRIAHYFAWVLVKEVNGDSEHEWCDGVPRILHFKKQIFDILDRELNGSKKTSGRSSKHRRPEKTSIFYEMIDPMGENDKVVPCEGRDFLISAVKEKGFTTYKSDDFPSEFINEAYAIATNDKEYEEIVTNIESLEDYILNNHKFNTYEEIQARLNRAINGEDNETSVDDDDGEDNDTVRTTRQRLRNEVEDSDDSEGSDEEAVEEKSSLSKRPTRKKGVFDGI